MMIIVVGSGWPVAFASGPSSNRILNYQMRLTDENGISVPDGAVNVKLTVYTAASGGSQLYTICSADGTATGTPTAVQVTFTNAIGSVLIGDTSGITCASGTAVAVPDTLFNNTALYLGVTIGADSEMTPRKRIVSAGYAMNADRLDDLETDADGATSAYVPITDANGNLVITGNPQGTGVTQGSVTINPTTADANEVLFGVALGGSSRFTIDEDGDAAISNDLLVGNGLTVTGSTILNGAFTLGDGGDTGSINTSDWDISTTGGMTLIDSISNTSANLALSTITSGNITLTTGAAAGLVNVLTGSFKVGNGTPGVALNGEDAYIEGTFEVDGTTQFDGTVTANSTLTANGTLDGNGLFTLGDGGDTGAIDTSDWDITTTGVMSNIASIAGDASSNLAFTTVTAGDFTFTTAAAAGLLNVLTGNLKVGNGTPGVALGGEDAYVEGTFEVDGATRFDGAITSNNRLDTAAHAANVGLNLPTYAGAPSAVTGTAEGDIVYDSTNNALYVYDGAAFAEIGGGVAGANTSLSNLSTVAINTHLLPDTDGAWDLGTTAARWRDLPLAGALTVAGTTILNGAFTLGDGGDTGSINTSDWDISTTGGMTLIDSISNTSANLALSTITSGNITLTTGAAAGLVNVLTGSFKVGDGTPGVALNGEDAYVEGTFEVDGASQFDGTVTANGTLDGNGLFTLGDGGDTGAIDTSDWDITTTGVMSNIASIAGDASSNLAFTTVTAGDFTFTTAAAAGLLNVLTGNLKVGNGTPSVALGGEDAYVEGTFEVDGATQFDGAVTANSTLTSNGRLDTAAHAANVGLNLPTNVGAPGSVTGTAEGDIVYDTTNNALYVYDGAAFTEIGAGDGGITQVGSMTTSPAFADATADDDWLGLGAAAGRILFDDQTTDEVIVMTANFGIGDETPAQLLTVGDGELFTVSSAGAVVANGAFTLGDGGDTGSINTSDWDISTTGGMTLIDSISNTSANLALSTITSGNITLTTGAAAGLVNVLTGSFKVGDGTPTVALNGEDAYVEGTFEVDGTSRFDSTLTANGILDANATFTLGDGGEDGAIDTIDWDISTTGAMSNIASIAGDASTNLAFTTVTAGDFTFTTAAAAGLLNVLTGNLKVGNGTPGVALGGEDAYVEGTFEVDGATRFDGAITSNNRLDTAAHAANVGLNLPTYAGAPSAVTGTAEGDIVYDSTNNALYVYDGAAFAEIGGGVAGANTSLSNLSSVAVNTDLLPDTDGAWDLGTTAARWRDLPLAGALTVAGTTILNGAFTLGDNGDTGSINTSDWDISTTGGMTLIDSISNTSANLALSTVTSGNITLTTGAAAGLVNVLTGSFKVGNGTPGVALNGEDAYIEGTFEVDGASQFDGTVTANSTLDGNGLFTLGDNGDTGAIDTSDWDITTTGVMSNIASIAGDASSNLAFTTVTAGDFTFTTAAAAGLLNVLTGNLKVGDGAPSKTIDGEDAYIEGTLETGSDLYVYGTMYAYGAFALGDGGDTGSIDTSDWNISTTGAMTLIDSISNTSANLALSTVTTGNITLTTGAGAGLVNVLTGNLKVGNGTPGVSMDGEDAYIEGMLEVDGTTQLDGTLTHNGKFTLGDGGDDGAIDTSDWDIGVTGAMTNIASIAGDASSNLAFTTVTAGDFTFTPAAATGLLNVLTGNLKVGNGTPTVALNGEDAYIEGTLEVDGATRFDGAVTANSTLTANGLLDVYGQFYLGDNGDTGEIDTSDWDITADGAMTNIDSIASDLNENLALSSSSTGIGGGHITFTPAGAAYNAYVLTGNLSVGNAAPSVTLNGEDAYIEGTFEVDGASRFDSTLSISDYIYHTGDTDTYFLFDNALDKITLSAGADMQMDLIESTNDYVHIWSDATPANTSVHPSTKMILEDGDGATYFQIMGATASDRAILFGISGTGGQTNDGTIAYNATNGFRFYVDRAAQDIVAMNILPDGTTKLLTENAATATDVSMLTLDVYSTGTATTGLGNFIDFNIENGSGILTQAGELGFKWEYATNGSENSDFSLSTNLDGTLNEVLHIEDNGYFGFNQPAPTKPIELRYESANTSTLLDFLIIDHESSGTPAAGFGTGMTWFLEDAGGVGSSAASIDVKWETVTASSEDASIIFSTMQNATLSEAMRIGHDDGTNNYVGIGETTPVTRLEVTQSSAAVASFNRTTSDGVVVNIKQADVVEGDISVSGLTVSYNAFTGSHYAWTDTTIERGSIVVMTGDNRHFHGNPESEMLYGIAMTTVENDSRVLGSYLSLQEPTKPMDDDNPHLIMSVGNGDVWVVDEGENIEPGDHLITSTAAGHARKDSGNHLASYVFARASEPIDWSTVNDFAPNGKKHKKIIVTFESHVRYNYGKFFTFRDTEPDEPASEAITLTKVSAGEGAYKLSLTDALDEEIAYFGNQGDLGIKGRLFLSDRGTMQSNRYVYYDGSEGAGGDFIRTNASGWATGSYDFAEMYPSDETLQSGDIVMVDVANPGRVKRADDSVETNGWLIAGIVSTRPGFLAGMNDVGNYPIALEGRVPTTVSAENGAIAVGDPITISSVPGVGMKATERGYVVGTALEAFDGSTSAGTITVMLKMGYYNGTTVWDTNTTVSAESVGANTSTGILDMQGNPIIGIGALEGLDGLWSIDGEGKLTAKAVEADDLQTGAMTVKADDEKTTIGEGVILVGNSSAVIENPAVRYNSRIFVTFFANVGGNWWISERQDGRFVINLSAVAATDIPFEYWILDVKDDRTPVDPAAVEPPAEESGEAGEQGSGEEEPIVEEPAPEPPAEEPPAEEPPVVEEPAPEPPVVEEPAPEPPMEEGGESGESGGEEPIVEEPTPEPPADSIDTGTTS